MRQRKAINQINVVPYIDVMLVLLVIFMITAPLVAPGEIELPTIGSKLTVPLAPLKLTLNLDRSVQLQDPGVRNESVRAGSVDEAVALVRAKQAKQPDQAVVIAADKAARYEDVLGLLDRLQRSGVKKVGLLARPPGN